MRRLLITCHIAHNYKGHKKITESWILYLFPEVASHPQMGSILLRTSFWAGRLDWETLLLCTYVERRTKRRLTQFYQKIKEEKCRWRHLAINVSTQNSCPIHHYNTKTTSPIISPNNSENHLCPIKTQFWNYSVFCKVLVNFWLAVSAAFWGLCLPIVKHL